MIHIKIRRICEMRAPADLVTWTAGDWTHFTILHRKTIKEFRLVYKLGNRSIFLYKARLLYPFPIYKDYLIFREDLPEGSYRNVYLDIKNGNMNYLTSKVVKHGDTASTVGEFLLSVPDYWKLMPRLFFLLFKKRMKKIMKEDNDWIAEWAEAGSQDNKHCAPVIPESFDLFESCYAQELPKEDFLFEDHFLETFEKRRAP